MTLIEPWEMAEFRMELLREGIARQDIELSEINMSDPRSDEILAQRGTLTVTRISTGCSHDYAIVDGTTWVRDFACAVESGRFGQRLRARIRG